MNTPKKDRPADRISGGTVSGGGTQTPAEAPFSVQINRVAGGVRVALRGHCEPRDTGCLEHVLKDLVEGQGNKAVILDASDLVAVDGHVDDVLASVAAWAAGRGTQVTVSPVGPPPPTS